MSVAFFHAWLEGGVWVKPPQDLRLNDDWLWYVVKAFYGMRESSKAIQEVVREMYTTYGWTLLQTVTCLVFCGRLDSLAGWHGDDFHTEDEPSAVDEIDEIAIVQSESAPTSVTGSEHKRDRLEANPLVVRMASDARHVENLSSFFEVKGAKPSRTPSSRATGRGQRDVLETAKARESLRISVQTSSIHSFRQRNSLKTCRRLASCQC